MKAASIVFALAIAATARADGDRTLHLVVRGSIDSAALGASIAKELGLAVAVVERTCDLPCLDVVIDGKNTATVIYVPRSGLLRHRSVGLGSDTTQWPLVITLLAGNVVRDEARDVLTDLPPRALAPPAAQPGPVDVPPAPPDDDPAPAEAAPAEPADAPDAPAIDAPAVPAPAVDAPAVDAPAVPAPAPDAPADVPADPYSGPVAPPDFFVARPPAAESAHRGHRWLVLGLVPGLSTDLLHIGSLRHVLGLHLLVGVSGGSSGLSVSGIADIQRGVVSGFQIGGVVAYARRIAGGFQIGGIAAVARRVAGVQVAGVAAVAGDVNGVQIAGTAAVADHVDGFQVAGIAALARTGADTQVAGIAAVAGGDTGFQAGGITSVTRGTANIQIAGLVNVAHRVRGLQLAPINVARSVEGIQIGLINIGSADGFSFGLINIVPGGRYDLETAIDSHRTGTILFRHGGRRWHNVYGIGGHPVNQPGPSDDVWMYGLGFGPSLSFGNTVVDLEAIGWQVNHGPRHETDVSILGQLRLSIAHHWGPFAVVAGGILNGYVTSDQQSPLILERSTSSMPMPTARGVTLTTWPSAFVGVRL